jgi:hypothetical protein
VNTRAKLFRAQPRALLGLAATCLGVLAGCPSDDPTNGAVLYLAPDGSEIVTHLIEELPPPY